MLFDLGMVIDETETSVLVWTVRRLRRREPIVAEACGTIQQSEGVCLFPGPENNSAEKSMR